MIKMLYAIYESSGLERYNSYVDANGRRYNGLNQTYVERAAAGEARRKARHSLFSSSMAEFRRVACVKFSKSVG